MALSKMRVGSSATVRLDTAAGASSREQGVVRLDGTDVEEARSWRVTLGEPRFQGLPNPATVAVVGGDVPNVAWNVNPAFAKVSWGVQGADFVAEVDWAHGCSFCLSAEYINVSVVALNLVGNPLTPNPGVAIFPAQIAGVESLSPPSRPPTRTIYSGVIAAGAVARVKVPPFARRVRLQRAIASTPPEIVELIWWADAAFTQVVGFDQLGNGGLSNAQPIYALPIDVPPQAMVLQIRNGPATVNNQSWMLQYELDIG